MIHQHTRQGGLIGLLCVCVWLLTGQPGVLAGEPLQNYFTELRNRQLYSLAERYCLERLANKDLAPNQRIDFATELARTLMQQAATLPVDQQQDHWERAAESLTEARRRVGQHGRRWILELQQALIPCAQGETAVWQCELNPDDLATRTAGLQHLEAGISTLQLLTAELRGQLKKPIPKTFDETQNLWPVEVRQLYWAAQLELVRALVHQTRLRQGSAADQLEQWAGVDKALDLLLGSHPSPEIRAVAQILAATTARERADYPRAQRHLTVLAGDKLPPEIADLVVAEQVRLHWMLGDDIAAADLLRTKLADRTPYPGELGVLQIQSLLRLWRTARGKQAEQLAADLWQTATELQARLRVETSSYWALRGQLLLDEAGETSRYGAELAQALRQGRSLFATGNLAGAAQQYLVIAEVARQQNQLPVAEDALMTRGSLLIQLQQYATAAEVLQSLSTSGTDTERTAGAHLLAAYALGKLYEIEATKAHREAYTAALLAQRNRFPEHTSAGEAAWMLGQLEERRLQLTVALPYYQLIPSDHPRGMDAAVASARCYDQIVRRARELQQPTATWVHAALETLPRSLPTDPQTQLTLPQASIAVHLAHTLLQGDEPRYQPAELWLATVSRSCAEHLAADIPAEPDRWRELQRTALRLRIISLAGQGRTPEADRLLNELTETQPAELLTILDGLGRLVSHAQGVPQHQLGELQVRAARALQAQAERLTPAQRDRLEVCLAQGYIAAGRYPEARKIYQTLLQTQPQSRSLQEDYARLLIRFDDAAARAEALALWQTLVQQETAGTARWLTLRLEQARALIVLKRNSEAHKLLSVTRLLYPKLGTEAQRQELQTLEKQTQP